LGNGFFIIYPDFVPRQNDAQRICSVELQISFSILLYSVELQMSFSILLYSVELQISFSILQIIFVPVSVCFQHRQENHLNCLHPLTAVSL